MKKVFLILISMVCSLTILSAQSLTNAQRRNMNARLLELLDKYDTYSAFSESYMRYGYVKLFESESSPVYCDYVSNVDFQRQIPASEYARYTAEDLGTLYAPSAKSIKRGEYIFEDGTWHVTLTLERTTSYIDNLKVYFSGEFQLAIECVYIGSDDIFLISSITGVNKSGTHLPIDHFNVVNKSRPEDDFLTQHGEPLPFNDFHQAIVESNKFEYYDSDVVLRTKTVGETPRYSLLELTYLPKKSRLSVHFDYALNSAYDVKSTLNNLSDESSAIEVGLDYAHLWKISPRARLGLGFGVGLSRSEIKLETGNANFSYTLSDYGGPADTYREYVREYNLTKVTEGVKFMDAVIPFYLTWEKNLIKKHLILSLDVGVKLYLNAKTTVDPYTIEGTATNTYVDSSTPFYSGGLNFAEGYLSPTSYKRKFYDITFFVKGGFDIRLFKLNYLTLRVGYEKGITDSYVSAMHDWNSDLSNSRPIFYADGKDVRVRSLADCISYTRGALWLGFGFKFKL